MGASPALPPMAVEEFLDWADGREGRFELDEGHVVAMAPERVAHGRLKGSIYLSLVSAIGGDGRCEAFTDSVAVRIDPATSYVPDALVNCGKRLDGDAREATSPVIVVEVLSPSTAFRDASAKLRGYFRVESVHHYLIVDGDRRLVIHHRREADDLIATRVLGSGLIELEPPGLTVDLAQWLGDIR